MELVGAVDGAGALQQVQRGSLRAPCGLDHRLVLRAVLVGLEEDAVELLAHRRGALAGGELDGPGLDLQRDLLLALDAQQGGLDRLLGRLLEAALAGAAEVVRRLEQAEQGRDLLVRAGGGAEIVARQVGKAELLVGREFPGQVEVDLLRQPLRIGQQLGRRRLVEAQQHMGRLDLHTFAGVELDLHRAFGFRHQPAGEKLAGLFEQGVGHGRDCRPPSAWGQTVMPPETSITAPFT